MEERGQDGVKMCIFGKEKVITSSGKLGVKETLLKIQDRLMKMLARCPELITKISVTFAHGVGIEFLQRHSIGNE